MRIDRHGVGAVALGWVAVLAMVLGACGDDNGGGEDTLFTGLSGLVIFALVVWLVVRAVRKRR